MTPPESNKPSETSNAFDQTRARRIAEIRQRAEKATSGPWAWESTGEKSNDYAIGTAWGPDGEPVIGRIVSGDDPESGVWLEDTIVRRHLIGEGENGRFADAEFIAYARNDIPYLLDLLTEEAAASERYRVQVEERYGAVAQWQAAAETNRQAWLKESAARQQAERERDEARTELQRIRAVLSEPLWNDSHVLVWSLLDIERIDVLLAANPERTER